MQLLHKSQNKSFNDMIVKETDGLYSYLLRSAKGSRRLLAADFKRHEYKPSEQRRRTLKSSFVTRVLDKE
jgi:hypothetical protein